MNPDAVFSKETPVLTVQEIDNNYLLVDLDKALGLQKYDLVRVMRPDDSTFHRGLIYEVYEDCVCVQVERGNTYWL